MKQKVLEATKNILEKNMEINKSPFCDKKIVLVYDKDSELSILIWEAYAENLKNISNSEVIIFDEESTDKHCGSLDATGNSWADVCGKP